MKKNIKFLTYCLDKKIKNLVVQEIKFPQKFLKCLDRKIKLPRKKCFKPTEKLNSRGNFYL